MLSKTDAKKSRRRNIIGAKGKKVDNYSGQNEKSSAKLQNYPFKKIP
jgi:hypothetical protein